MSFPTAPLLPTPRPVDPGRERWLRVAADVAARLAPDALARDRAGAPPFAEAQVLRDSGLLGLRIPTSAGGAGADLATTFAVLRTIARVDGSIAHLLGYHHNFVVGSLSDADPEVSSRVWKETLEHGWLWASTGSPQDADLVVRRDGDRRTVSGVKHFATGSRVADRIMGFVVDGETGHRLVVALDPSRTDELHRRDDWNPLGQRLSASNGLELREYRIDGQDVLLDLGLDTVARPAWQTLGPLFSQVLFSWLCLGVAEGAVLAARDYTRTSARPWFHAEVDAASDDPYVLAHYGELVSRLTAVEALNDRATAALEHAYALGTDLDDRTRADVSTVVAASRVVANETTLAAVTRVYDVMGARATDNRFGFDLAWRNIRTLTLHDPQAYKVRDVGAAFLTGAVPTPSPYR